MVIEKGRKKGLGLRKAGGNDWDWERQDEGLGLGKAG